MNKKVCFKAREVAIAHIKKKEEPDEWQRLPVRIDQTCAGDAETTIDAEMQRELMAVASISTGTASLGVPPVGVCIVSCCSGSPAVRRR